MPAREPLPPRLRSLDGLRGVAAVVVVLAHCFLLALPHLDDKPGSLAWWLTSTPLHVLISGNEAVLVFFLLSGLVVALPALQPGFDWTAYYPRRLVRLYVPVIVSVGIASALIVAVPRGPFPSGSWAADQNARSVDPLSMIRESLLFEAAPKLNNPLWSLLWEVGFSLLLPCFVGLAVITRRWWLLVILGALILRVAGNILDVAALTYLPVFLIGTVAAASFARVGAAGRRITTGARGRWWWLLIGLGTIGCLSAGPILSNVNGVPGEVIAVARQSAVVGAIGVVFTAIALPRVVALLESRVSQWLGVISFSLYLVHVPVLVTVTALFPSDAWIAAIATGLLLSILTASLFHALVERPAHQLARHIGAVVEARRASRVAPGE